MRPRVGPGPPGGKGRRRRQGGRLAAKGARRGVVGKGHCRRAQGGSTLYVFVSFWQRKRNMSKNTIKHAKIANNWPKYCAFWRGHRGAQVATPARWGLRQGLRHACRALLLAGAAGHTVYPIAPAAKRASLGALGGYVVCPHVAPGLVACVRGRSYLPGLQGHTVCPIAPAAKG